MNKPLYRSRRIAKACVVSVWEERMTQLALASLFLPLSHFLIASTSLRAALINRLGQARYHLTYSALAVVAFVWLAAAYWQAPSVPLWTAPCSVRLALTPVVLVSSVLVVAGVTTPNPVIVRSERLFDRADVVRGVLRISRNPFFWGVGLIAVAHVVIMGRAGSDPCLRRRRCPRPCRRAGARREEGV
jgi:uncharacterized membrane protein